MTGIVSRLEKVA